MCFVFFVILYAVPKYVTAEIDFLRCSARVSRHEKIRNEVIKDKMNVKNSIVDFIQTRKLQWTQENNGT